MFVIKLYSNHVLLIHNSFCYLRCTCVYICRLDPTSKHFGIQFLTVYNGLWSYYSQFKNDSVSWDWLHFCCITSTASLDQISWKNLSTWSYRSQRMRWMKSSSTSKSSLTSERIWQLLAISVKSNDGEYKYICQIEKEVNKVMDTMYIYVYMYITCNVTFLDWQILQCFACYTVLLHLFWTANLLFIRE